MADLADIIRAFRLQSDWCRQLGSPFTAPLLDAAAGDLAAEGPLARLIGDWPGDPVADALALRLAGALHALVLSGRAPELAACYPPHGNAEAEDLRAAASAALAAEPNLVAEYLASPPQTNEVRRSGMLLGGFLEIARRFGRPLRLLEIGASAGLNQIWDRYRYRLGEAHWGDPASPVEIAPAWTGALPPLAAPLVVASRAACDRQPIDLEDPAQRLRLTAYIWADQRHRLDRTEAAIEMARQARIRVERADAAQWVERELTHLPEGITTVLYHSVMWQYLLPATQSRIVAALDRAGGRATAETGLAWLRMEPPDPQSGFDLTLTSWPTGGTETLAKVHAHGESLRWLG